MIVNNSMPYYVESDGDRVPKDVYICDGQGRVLTMECASEDRRFRLARQIVSLLNAAQAKPNPCDCESLSGKAHRTDCEAGHE